MECRPKCEYCGRFLSDDDLANHFNGSTDKIDSRMHYVGGPIPEPWGNIYWHVGCLKKTEKENEK